MSDRDVRNIKQRLHQYASYIDQAVAETCLDAEARIDELEALCQQALVVIRQGVDEVFKLEFDKTGTGWDPGGFLAEARRVLKEPDE